MSVKHPCDSRKECGDYESNQLVFCDIYSYRFRRYSVIPDSHDCSSCSGMNKIEYYHKGYENQGKADEVIGVIRCIRYTHGAVYVDFFGHSVKCNIVICLHTYCEVNPVCVRRQIKVVYNILYDFSECQSNYSQIVPSQSENGNSYQKPDNRCRQTSYDESQREPYPHGCDGFLSNHGEHASNESPYAHETCMTQTQLSQNTYCQVKRNRQYYIHTDRNQQSPEKMRRHACSCIYNAEKEHSQNDSVCDHVFSCGFVHIV